MEWWVCPDCSATVHQTDGASHKCWSLFEILSLSLLDRQMVHWINHPDQRPKVLDAWHLRGIR